MLVLNLRKSARINIFVLTRRSISNFYHMKIRILPRLKILLTFIIVICSFAVIKGQKADTLTEELKGKIFDRLNNFTIGFYIDTYYNWTLGGKTDTANVVPFSSNCPVHDQIRMNVAAFEVAYHAEKTRGKFILQFGDAPNLLAAPEAQFIKNLRQANFGFRLIPDLWIDFGYMLNPVGFESSWPVINQISSVTIGGYYEPGSILGIKLSYKFSEKFSGVLIYGNPYSLAYGKNVHGSGMISLTYKPLQNLTINYNNLFGNQALRDANIDNNLLYNNLITIYNPVKFLSLTGQLDVAFQTNSRLAPDTNKVATMVSAFLQARFMLNKHVALSMRGEILNDPNGFLTGTYKIDGKLKGLKTAGFTVGGEYKPINSCYVRLEYRYLHANDGNFVFYSNTSDYMEQILLTTGLRF